MVGALVVVLGIVFFVTVHELGHFLAARATGMKATEMFFGFGPRLWSVKKGETEYGLRLLPFGGFVKIAGMGPFHDEEIDPELSYYHKKFWQKMTVALSGVAMNFLMAFVILVGLFLVEGVTDYTTRVMQVVDELADGTPTPASQAGIQVGDLILAVDGIPTPTWEETAAMLGARPGEPVLIRLSREGVILTVETTLATRYDQNGVARGFLGVGPSLETRSMGLGEAMATASDEIAEAVGAYFPGHRAVGQPGVFGGVGQRDVRRGGLRGQPSGEPDRVGQHRCADRREGSGQRGQVASIFEHRAGCFQHDSCVSAGRGACGGGSL